MDYLMTVTVPAAPRPPQQLPVALQQAFVQQIARIEATGMAYEAVVKEAATLNGYATWRAFTALLAVTMLRDLAASQGRLTPEVDQMLGTLTAKYLHDVDIICRFANAKLLQLAQDVANGTASPATVGSQLRLLLKG